MAHGRVIDTDTRQLRRNATGQYTSGAGKIVCDHCGFNKICPMRDKVAACDQFLPTLPFNDDAGMQKLFNTVRIGRAWVQRLVVGQKVALYNATDKRVFGFASVLATFDGSIDEMLNRHAHANHLMLSQFPEEAQSILHQWLKRNYGPHIVHDNTTLTAIYLLREHFPPIAPSFD